MSKYSNAFTLGCKAAGIYHERCGAAVRDLLLELREAPLRVQVSSYGGVKMPKHASMGVALQAGLARFVREDACYVITPAGLTWLTELESHGLMDLGRAAA